MIILVINIMVSSCWWEGLTASGSSKSAANDRKTTSIFVFGGDVIEFISSFSALKLQTFKKDTTQIKAILMCVLADVCLRSVWLRPVSKTRGRKD